MASGSGSGPAPGGRSTPAPFIAKTFDILQDTSHADVVRWGAAGASIVIAKVRVKLGDPGHPGRPCPAPLCSPAGLPQGALSVAQCHAGGPGPD